MEQRSSSRQRPLRQALREARAIVVIVLATAATYLVFAANTPPLIFESAPRDSAGAGPVDSSGIPPAAVDTSALSPADTSGTGDVSGVDSAAHADSVAKALAARSQKIADSLRLIGQRSSDTAKSNGLTNGAVETPAVAEDTETFLARVATMKVVDTETAKRVFDLKRAVFIDARPESQFEEGHIPGAINVYGEAFDPHVPQIVQIPRDRQIIVYCGGGDCELSHDVADRIRALGIHKKVSVYTGGTAEWLKKQYPFIR